ncbi:alpha-amylase family glycosyl hydrolase, partial [Acinetobacter baumannii]
KGLIRRLDYIKGMGMTALWVGPIFRNKPVQGAPGQDSAGYHGYWITDFTRVDPHFGTNADFKALVDAAHAQGLKVYMDIVANHTADV